MMDYGMGWGFGWIGMILSWLVPILLVVVALKYLFAGKTGPGARDDHDRALAILEEKYARGEISREEFVQKRDDLKRG